MAPLTDKQSSLIDQIAGITTARTPAPSPRASLTTGQKILTNPTVSKAIDILSGGMTPQEADVNALENVSRWAQYPKMAGDVGKFLLKAGTPAMTPDKAIKPTEIADAANAALGIVSAPFVPAAGALTSAIHAPDKSPAMLLQSAMKGAVAPQTAPPLFKGITDQPLTPWEREGSVARLIPRATMQAAEQVALAYMLGVPGAVKKGYQQAKVSGVARDFAQDFSKIEQNPQVVTTALEKQGLFPRGITPEAKADLTTQVIARLKTELPMNPKVGDYYMAKQTAPKLASDINAMLGERGEVAPKLPEKGKPSIPAPKAPALPAVPPVAMPSTTPPPSGQISQPITPAKPPVAPPKTTFEQPEDWEEPIKPSEIKKQVMPGFENIKDKELVKEMADFVSAFEPSQLIIDAEGNYTRTGSSFVGDFANKGYTKKYLQDIYKKYAEGSALAPKEASDLIYTADVFREMMGMEKTSGLEGMVTTKDLRRNKQTNKLVLAIAKKLSKMPSAGQVKESVRQITTKQRTPLTTTEEAMLKRELGQEQKAAKVGYQAGRREEAVVQKAEARKGRVALINELKNRFGRKIEEIKRKGELDLLEQDIRRRDVLKVKNQVIQYVKDNLPVDVRGKYLTEIGNAKTGGDLIGAFRRVDKEADNIERKAIIEEIKKTYQRISESKRIDVENQKKIMEIFNEIDFTKRRPETLDKLREMKKAFDRKAELGEEMEIPLRIWNKLDILLRRPVGEIPIAELQNIKEEMDILAQVGKTKLRIRESIYDLQKERMTGEITEGAMPLEKHPLVERQPGEKFSLEQMAQNAIAAAHNVAIKLDIINTPMDSFFDLLDGGAQTFDGPVYRTFKQTADTDFQNYMRSSAKDKKLLVDLSHELKITGEESEVMGVYAAKIQQDGARKLAETGVSEETISKAELNPKTEKVYQLWRKISEELKPRIAKVMREEWNLPFEEVENYFPFVTDFEKMSDSEIYNRFGKDFTEKSILEEAEQKRAGKKVKFSFMEKRIGGAQKIQLDFIDVALKHIDNAHYMINMSRTLRMLKEISNDPKVEAALGELGSKYTKEWLDLLVKKGGRLGDQQIAVLDILRRNFGIARLGFNISTGLIQTTAIMDGAMVLGNDVFLGLNDVILSQRARLFVLENMPEVRQRAGDDPAYSDFSKIPVLKQGQKLSYDHIKFFDRLAAMGTGLAAYRQNLAQRGIAFDYDKPDNTAIEYAQQVVRRTQASSLFKDTPPSLRGGLTGNRSLDRFINQFQTFMLNRWNNIRNYTWRAKIMGGRGKDPGSRDFPAAFNAVFYLILAVLTETALRRGEKKLEKKIIEKLSGGYIPQKSKMTFAQESAVNLLQSIPFVSQAISIAVYRGEAAPAMSGPADLATGAKGIVTAKTPETKKKSALDLLSGVGGVFGLPAVGQIEKTGRMTIDARTKDSVIEMYKEALLNPDKAEYWNARADKLAKELGLSIKRMKEKAEDSLKRGESKKRSEIEESLRNKTDEEFNKEISGRVGKGTLSSKAAKLIRELRKDRFKAEKNLQKELKEQKTPASRITPEQWAAIEALTQ